MATKRVFTAFAIEDKTLRDLLVGQRLHADTPFEWTDMSVKEPWDEQWKSRCRTRIKSCDGVIGIITKNTPKATGQLWELKCAYDEGKTVMLIHGYSDVASQITTIPAEILGRSISAWTWAGIEAFIKKI
jgi:hypothetical protein